MDKDTVFFAFALGWCTYTLYVFLLVLHKTTWAWELEVQGINETVRRKIWELFPGFVQEVVSQWRWEWDVGKAVFEAEETDSTTAE
jgi:hypothetical protein